MGSALSLCIQPTSPAPLFCADLASALDRTAELELQYQSAQAEEQAATQQAQAEARALREELRQQADSTIRASQVGTDRVIQGQPGNVSSLAGWDGSQGKGGCLGEVQGHDSPQRMCCCC